MPSLELDISLLSNNRRIKTQSLETDVLVRLIRSQKWSEVIRYVQQYPTSTKLHESTSIQCYIATPLLLAIRNGCSCIRTLRALVKANRRQIAVINYHHGTILHEVLQYYCCKEVQSSTLMSTNPSGSNACGHRVGKILMFLLRQLKQYHNFVESSSSSSNHLEDNEENYGTDGDDIYIPKHTNIDQFMSVQDSTGRTIFHLLAELVISIENNIYQPLIVQDHQQSNLDDNIVPFCDSESRVNTSTSTTSSSSIFGFFIECLNCISNPSILRVLDNDKNTPLLTLIQSHYFLCNRKILLDNNEAIILSDQLIQYILQLDPVCATISRTLSPIPQRGIILSSLTPNTTMPIPLTTTIAGSMSQHVDSCTTIHASSSTNTTTVPVNNSPLYYAILHRRSFKVINNILNAQKSVIDSNSIDKFCHLSPAIVTPFHETCLHVCVTSRSSLDVIQAVLDDNPYAVLTPDIYGLTPIDWLWLCYVVDWNYNTDDDEPAPTGPDYHFDIDYTTRTTIPLQSSQSDVQRRLEQQHPPNDEGADQQEQLGHLHRNRIRTQLISRRRSIGGSLFNRWLQNTERDLVRRVSSLCVEDHEHSYTDDQVNIENVNLTNTLPSSQRRQRREYLFSYFCERLNLLVPIAAELSLQKGKVPSYIDRQGQDLSSLSSINSWFQHSTIVHAACLVRCPSMVLLASTISAIQQKDSMKISGSVTETKYSNVQFDKNDKNTNKDCNQLMNNHMVPVNFSVLLSLRDSRLFRYPLHYAACRNQQLYTMYYPVRPSLTIQGGVQRYVQTSPIVTVLPYFPEASKVTDCDGQLPLHIVIDSMKQYRYELEHKKEKQKLCNDRNYTPTMTIDSDNTILNRLRNNNVIVTRQRHDTIDIDNDDDEAEFHVLQMLLDANPMSLDVRDGITKLYPFQQAAVGDGANLSTIYYLLRKDPSLLRVS